MLRNYLLIAARHFRRRSGYALINVAGLSVGLASCAFIVLFVVDDLRYDRFFDESDRIVRIVENKTDGDSESRLATTYGPLAPALVEDVAGIDMATRFMPYSVLVSNGPSVRHQEDRFAFVDSTFLEVFSFELIAGSAESVLDRPFTVVLTETAAARYFGSEDPVGHTIQVRDDETTFDFVVTGIVADPPAHTHLQFDFLAAFVSMRTIYGDWIDDPRNWEHPPLYTYALLRNGFTSDALAAVLPAFAAERMGPQRTASRSLHVERLRDIHLYSDRQGDISHGSSRQNVYLLALIGLLILVVACINYVNLATARAASRSREIGMRKALGARRSQLARQFLMEAVLTVLAASMVAVLLVAAAFPAVQDVSGRALPLDLVATWWTPLAIAALLSFVGFAAGGYPAVYLASQRPGWMLKGRRHAGSEAFVRRGLVVFQYVVSVVLITATLVVIRQLDFMMNERLGFDKEHVVVVPIRDMEKQMASSTLLERWRNIRGVQAATASSGMPGLEAGLHDFMVFPERGAQDSLSMDVLSVDHDYVETYGMEITAGRDFDPAYGSDVEGGFLINESAARLLGWDDPVGERLSLRYYFSGERTKVGEVVGVVRDFQYHSLHRGADPILFHIIPNSYYDDFASARLDGRRVGETLEAMESAWNTFNPSRPLEYHFLDEQFDALYNAEHRLSRLFGIFAAISIFTACLGLFGLAAFSIQERTKEIGIRKVLGAGIGSIVALISLDFLRIVFAACCVALPVSYVLMAQWLQSFASRINLGVGVFALPTFIVLALALVTVGVHTLRAGLSDPVESLRHE